MEMLLKFTVLILSFITSLIDGSDVSNIQLQVCMQKEEGKRESLPLTHRKVKAVQLWQGNTDGEISIDVCASKHMMKMTLPLHTGLKGDITLCMKQVALTPGSDSLTCFSLSVLRTVKSNSSITCWFRQNVTENISVVFYMRILLNSEERLQNYTYSGGAMLHNRGLCEPSVCDKVEPLYADMLYCGGKDQMKIPSKAIIWRLTIVCAFCENPLYDDIPYQVNETDSTSVTMKLGDNLQQGRYNLTVFFKIQDEFGENQFCGYFKTVTIFCIGGSTTIPSTRGAKEANIAQSRDSNNTSCDTNISHCSFMDFVLFGSSVSAVIIVIICFVAFIFVKRKKIAWTLRSICCGNRETVSIGGEPSLTLLNNHTKRDSPVSTHFPKHAHFHRTDEQYRLLFLPRPFDSFTRDCMDSLRRILSLNGRIPSSCVFDKSIQDEIFANKFQWIDKVLGDRHNILIFLCFTSPSVKHEQSIVDEVMRKCQPPATPPTCRTFFAHMTDSAENVDEISFTGRRFHLMNEKEFERFLEAVFIFYGYRADNEDDKQKFKQILHCGVSKHFLRKLRTPCSVTYCTNTSL